jgi:uncharacterized membrane protein
MHIHTKFRPQIFNFTHWDTAMDGSFILGVLIVYLLFSNSNLKKRVKVLEAGSALQQFTPAEQIPTSDQSARQEAIIESFETENLATEDFNEQINSVTPSFSEPVPETVAPTGNINEAAQGPLVFSTVKLTALVNWMMQNWFYVVAAVSLALAGIFLVQYGMEQGLLPPAVRVMTALAFGIALIGAGEYVRRRFGDSEDFSTAYLPSTFSSAGIVTLFSAILSARLLYGFIGPELTFIGMAIVGALAIILGWFYGPLLAAIGIIGAMIAPFAINGTSDDPSWLFAYFGLVTIIGLTIDTMQKWAWVSILSLGFGFASATLLSFNSDAIVTPFFVIYCAVLSLVSITIPLRKIVPDHQGMMLSQTLAERTKNNPWPEFPTRLGGGTVLISCGLIVLASAQTSRTDIFWTAIFALAALTLMLLIWARNAPALTDLTSLPALAVIAVVANNTGVWRIVANSALNVEAGTEMTMPMMPSIIVAIGILISAASTWRSLKGEAGHIFLAAGAALFAPLLAVILEVLWKPAVVIGVMPWALHALVLSVVMVVIAERFARLDGPENRLRMSLAALSALACIAFGVTILFSSAALTIALVVTVAAAAWLDRQFNLPIMGLYILAGIIAVGYRLVLDPGLIWAQYTPLAEVLSTYASAVIGFAIALVLIQPLDRQRSQIFLESAVFSTTGLLVSVILYRFISYQNPVEGAEFAFRTHWGLGLGATTWIVLGIAQLKRLEAGGGLAFIRKILGSLFLLFGALQLGIAVVIFNPALNDFGTKIIGPAVFNTLIPAYLLPAIVMAVGGFWLAKMPTLIRRIFFAFAVALSALWLTLTIRHFWRGADGMSLQTIEQNELYTYTVALLSIGAALFYQSLARHNALLRRAGLVVIGLAVAKVFLVDISGLGGLIRVFSLLFLGAALAGLAWLNRWAVTKNKGGNHGDSDVN